MGTEASLRISYFHGKNKNSGIWYKMNSNGLKYDIVSAQEYPDEKSFKFRIRLLEHQTILENDYADLTKECAKMKRLYPNTAFTFGVRDSRGYLFWMNYTDTRRALFLEDLDDPEFINKWFDMYRARETNAFNPEVTTNLTKNVTGVFKVGTIVEIIFRNNKFMYMSLKKINKNS